MTTKIGMHRRAIVGSLAAISIALGATAGIGATSASADTGKSQVSHVWLSLTQNGGATVREQYFAFLSSVRNAAGHSFRGDTSIAQSAAQGIIRVDVNIGGSGITFWVTPQDLYVVGFSNSSGNTFRFNDLDDATVGRLTNAAHAQGFNGPVTTLSYGGNYNSLSNAAERGRENTPISNNDIYNMIYPLAISRPDNVSLSTEGRNAARALILAIQFVSEAARFNDVAGVMGEALNNQAPRRAGLPAQLQHLENNWARISQFGVAVSNNPSTTPVNISNAGDPDHGNPTPLTLRSFSDVSRRLGILLGNFNLPTEGISGDWSHTEL
ncbi:ribosome-inactivating family protein [Streptomyces sp. NPDC059215]|uniref:ribosome-inactivating family protein n=1 Tax=Streptomyces sp. NPDC059215 TaxID=3346772 RepID=UPI0036C53EF5